MQEAGLQASADRDRGRRGLRLLGVLGVERPRRADTAGQRHEQRRRRMAAPAPDSVLKVSVTGH